jgi:hypothetical protein
MIAKPSKIRASFRLTAAISQALLYFSSRGLIALPAQAWSLGVSKKTKKT